MNPPTYGGQTTTKPLPWRKFLPYIHGIKQCDTSESTVLVRALIWTPRIVKAVEFDYYSFTFVNREGESYTIVPPTGMSAVEIQMSRSEEQLFIMVNTSESPLQIVNL